MSETRDGQRYYDTGDVSEYSQTELDQAEQEWDMSENKVNVKKVSEKIFKEMWIHEDWFVYGADFDCEHPYLVIAFKDGGVPEQKIPVPETMAYYLKTHFCGSHRMHEDLKEMGRIEVRNQIKDALGIK